MGAPDGLRVHLSKAVRPDFALLDQLCKRLDTRFNRDVRLDASAFEEVNRLGAVEES